MNFDTGGRMAGFTLSIILDKPNKTYEGGETITGQVRIVATEDVRTAALMVVLYCKGYSEEKSHLAGTGITTVEREIKQANLFKGPLTSGEYFYPFTFIAPLGPRSYKGHVFDVTWHLGAKVCTSRGNEEGVKAEENITLLPGERSPSQDQWEKGTKEVVYRASARSLKGFFAFSLVLCLIGIVVGWKNSPFGETGGDVMGVFLFGGVIPLLLGLAVLFCATYQALGNRRINKAEVRLGSREASPGGKISCCVTFEANIPFEVDKVIAVLKAEEIVDFRDPSRKNGKLRKHLLYENKQELPLAVKKVPTKVPIRVEGEVLIPDNVPCSIDLMESREGMAIQWDIEFVIEMKKWPDWIHFEDITVQQ
jgi:hypothetical protein